MMQNNQFLPLWKQLNEMTFLFLLTFSIWAILLTGEVISAIVLGGFMALGRKALWSWYFCPDKLQPALLKVALLQTSLLFFSDFLTHTPSVSE